MQNYIATGVMDNEEVKTGDKFHKWLASENIKKFDQIE